MEDTIVALATAAGVSGIQIIRLSGSQASEIVERCFMPKNRRRWQVETNYTLHLGLFRASVNDQVIDQVLISRMLAPGSYTGEDIYEINCHGGLLIARRIIEACLQAGARLAERGEFTKRAFLNGKLDLIQAEALIDLINARTDEAHQLAFAQLNGALSAKINRLRQVVLDAYSFIEAGIDFPEDDVEDLDRADLLERIRRGIGLTQKLLNGSKTGQILRDGLKTVIAGRPNVGKSSLLNALLQDERAIVTDIPGTTRDALHESVQVGGILLHLIDTAGIRQSEEEIEQLGIARTWKLLPEADLILLMVEVNTPFNDDERMIVEQYQEKVIVLANKCDLIAQEQPEIYAPQIVWLPFSVWQRRGFDELEREIQTRVYHGHTEARAELLSNLRQIQALEQAYQALTQAEQAIQENIPWDIISIDVRRAMGAIAEITGEDVTESLLENIFSRFCIGK